MIYNCIKCRDTKRITYEYQHDRFTDPVNVTQICECDKSMSDRQFWMIRGTLDAQCLYSTNDEMVDLINDLLKDYPEEKPKMAKLYGVKLDEGTKNV